MIYQKQWEFLKNKFKSGQLGHAYLFSGTEETNVNSFVREFIKLINCIFPNLNGSGNQEKIKKSCGECQNCKLIEKESFPDLLTIKSVDSTSSIKNEKDMMEIDVAQMREANNFLSYKPYYGNFKVVMINDAEKMNYEAQNCFLKNLEEPKGKTLIILISSKPALLLQTIFSRCQEIRFFYTGRYEILKDEQKILQDLQIIISSDLAEKFQYAKKVNLESGNFKKILVILQKYLRQLLLSKIGVIFKTPASNGKSFTVGQLKKTLELVEKMVHQSNIYNLNFKLALEVLLMEL